MAYTPLTEAQFNSAIKAGYTPQQIIENEKVRKAQSEAPAKKRLSDTITDAIGGRAIADTFGAAIARSRAPEEQKNLIEAPSVRETIGSGIQVGSLLAGLAGVGPFVAGKVLGKAAPKLLKAAPKLLTETLGAGAEGLAFGVGNKLQDGEMDWTTPAVSVAAPSVLKVAGKLAGTAKNAVAPLFESAAKAPKDYTPIIETIAPNPSAKAAREALESGEATITEGGMFTPSKLDYSGNPSLNRAAISLEDVIAPGARASVNLPKVQEHIANVAEKGVSKYLSENKVPFNFEDFRTRMEMVQPRSSLKSSPEANTTYTRIREEVLQDVNDFLKKKADSFESEFDLNDAWDARKVLDRKIKEEMGDTVFDSPQYIGAKAAAQDLRNEINNFIADSLSYKGQQEQLNNFYQALADMRERGVRIQSESDAYDVLQRYFGIRDKDLAKGAYFKMKMQELSDLYGVRDNLIERAIQDRGKSGAGLFLKQVPVVREILKTTGIGAAVNVIP